MDENAYEETVAVLRRVLGRAVVAAQATDEAVLTLDFADDRAGAGSERCTLASYACGWRLETADAVLA